jgi:hypothetical protein
VPEFNRVYLDEKAVNPRRTSDESALSIPNRNPFEKTNQVSKQQNPARRIRVITVKISKKERGKNNYES